MSPGTPCRRTGEVMVEPDDRVADVDGLLGRRVLGRGVAEVAEIEPLRPGEELPRGGRLVHVEEEVVPPLQEEGRHRERVEVRP